jgi:hypothetical protein
MNNQISVSCPTPNSQSMSFDQQEKRRKNYVTMRSVKDYGMGLLILTCGIFFLFSEKFGVTIELDTIFRNLFGGMCVVYGLFRIYRGYKKNYYSE